MHTPLFFVLRWVASKVSPAQGALLAATPVLRAEDRFQVGVLLVQLFLFQLHLMRRLYESLEVANFSKGSKQHALITAVGQLHGDERVCAVGAASEGRMDPEWRAQFLCG